MRPLPRTPLAVVGVAAAIALTTAVLPAGAVPSAESDPGPLTLDQVKPDVDDGDFRRAALEFGTNAMWQFDLDRTVQQVSTTEVDGEEVVVTLASDVLFDVDSAELAPAAVDRVTALVAEVPQGATLAVDGHTDSVADDAHNQDLSERRAQAVADVVAGARADLALEVTGYGETRLKVTESGDDIADDRAQNRRVELRYRAAETTTATETTAAPPVPATYTPGGGPRVQPVDPDAVVVEQVLDVPGADGVQVRVGVEPLVVRGPVTRVRVHFTPLAQVEERFARPSVFQMTGTGDLHVQAFDVESLTTYRPARRSIIEWETHHVVADAAVGQTVRYETYLARPVSEADALDVSIVPEWPRFEGVPVTWD